METARDSETLDLKKCGQGAATRNQTGEGCCPKTIPMEGCDQPIVTLQKGSQENSLISTLKV